MNRLSHLFKIPETRMKAVVSLLLVMVLATVFFIVHENQVHRENYLDVYRSQQLIYTETLADQLVMVLEDGEEAGDVASWMEEACEVSANRWSFLCKGDEVVFAKDQKTTQNLRAEKEKSAFMDTIREQKAVLTMAERQIGGANYVIGTITDEDYALSKASIQQHEIYVYLVFGIFILLAVMTVIGLTAKLNEVQRTLQNTSDTLRRQNVKLERAGEEAVLAEQPEETPPQREEQEFYDAALIRMFLKKSEDAALMPMQILYIDLVMESRYYSRNEIFERMEAVKKFLAPTHVMGEIQKGHFVVLMYRTTKEEAERILEQCGECPETDGEEKEIRLKLRLVEVKEGENPLSVYEEGGDGGNE